MNARGCSWGAIPLVRKTGAKLVRTIRAMAEEIKASVRIDSSF
jgi:hypothetical protein